MEKIYLVLVVPIWLFSVYVAPFPISRLSTKSNVKENDLQERDLLAIDPLLQHHKEHKEKNGNNRYYNPSESHPPDGPETPMPMGNLMLRLFPEFSTVNVQSNQTKKPLLDRFYPKFPEKEGKEGDKSNSNEMSPRAPEPAKIGGKIPNNVPTEKTISIPPHKKDFLGNWVYNPWAVTYGVLFRDTRFLGGGFSENRVYQDMHTRIYNPFNKPKEKVCKIESTLYNTPEIRNYIRHPFYQFIHKSDGINLEVRKSIYEKGNSEECHVPEQIHWRTFIECSMMRHMRMEYLIPNYPLQPTQGNWDYVTWHNDFRLDDHPTNDDTYDYDPRQYTVGAHKIHNNIIYL